MRHFLLLFSWDPQNWKQNWRWQIFPLPKWGVYSLCRPCNEVLRFQFCNLSSLSTHQDYKHTKNSECLTQPWETEACSGGQSSLPAKEQWEMPVHRCKDEQMFLWTECDPWRRTRPGLNICLLKRISWERDRTPNKKKLCRMNYQVLRGY